MDKKRRRQRRSQKREPVRTNDRDHDLDHEAVDGTVRAVSILWMLTLWTAALCELGMFIAARLSQGHPDSGLALLADVLYFASLVFGSICMGLLVPASRLHDEPLPQPLVAASLVVGFIPLMILLSRAF
ncbi:MAG: hypothetical protein N2C14_21235 [Planctomycetales bacterium]